MTTQCSKTKQRTMLPVTGLKGRRVDVDFSAGRVSSDGGAVLLRQLDLATGFLSRLATSFTGHRDAARVEHSVEEILRQRVFGLVLGYEDLNDHDELSRDPLIASMVGKRDPTGQGRSRTRDYGHSGASASTLGRLERTCKGASSSSRYAKIEASFDAMREVFVEEFVEEFSNGAQPARVGPRPFGHSPARRAGSALFSRVLRPSLLLADVLVLWRISACGGAAAFKHRRCEGVRGDAQAGGGAASQSVSLDSNRRARRQRVLS